MVLTPAEAAVAESAARPLDAHRAGEFLAYQGKLAQFRGSRLREDRPAREVTLAVARSLAAEDYHYLLGRRPYVADGGSWSGTVPTGMGGEVVVRCDDWPVHTVELAVPRPMDGLSYTWTWMGGATLHPWARAYFPRCAACDRHHDPARAHCVACGRARPRLARDGRCATCRRAGVVASTTPA